MQGDKSTLGRRFVLGAALALMVGALTGVPALAQSFQDLRASGAIGEAFDGYARVRSEGRGAQSLVDTTNAQRRTIYQTRAQEQGISVDQVGRVYAKAIFDKAQAGDWFLLESGKWIQK